MQGQGQGQGQRHALSLRALPRGLLDLDGCSRSMPESLGRCWAGCSSWSCRNTWAKRNQTKLHHH